MSWLRYVALPEDPSAPPPPAWARGLNFAAALAGLAAIFWWAFARLGYHTHWDAVWGYRALFIRGWFVTLGIAAASLVLSAALGLCCALARRSRILAVRSLAAIYVETIRGTPLLVQTLVFFYVVANAVHMNNRYVAGVAILSVFSGAYITEIIRAGIESVGRSQLESARAIGLTRAQTYRHVIFPQAMRQILPPLAGQFVSLVKDSSILSIISISEFTWNAEMVNTYTFGALESYLPLAAGYLLLTLPISYWARRLERRHAFDT